MNIKITLVLRAVARWAADIMEARLPLLEMYGLGRRS